MTATPEPGPVLIEAAICPFRPDAPVLDDDSVIAEARACLDAGAAIVHHHHDTRLDPAAALDALIAFGTEVHRTHPHALLYPGILGGRSGAEHTAHLEPMADAGALDLAPVDPGAAVPYDLDSDALPIGHGHVWNSFGTSRRVADSMRARGVPLTIGVYEPVQLRWAMACESAGRLAAGTMIKLYFGGAHSLFEIGTRAINFGLPPTRQALDMYLSMMEESALPWSVGVMGDPLLDTDVARAALERGGHLRVGIEDIGGVTDDTNLETVHAARALAEKLGRPVATGRTARDVLAGAPG